MVSLGRRLVIVVGAAALPALGAILYGAFEARRVHVEVGRTQMLRTVSQTVRDQEAQFREAERMLALVARLPAVRQGDTRACEAALAPIQRENEPVAVISRVGPDLRMDCSTLAFDSSLADVSKLAVVTTPLKRRKATYGFYRLTIDGTTPYASVIRPEYDQNGRLLFLLGADLRLPWFDHQRQLARDSSLSVAIGTEDGHLILLVSGARELRNAVLPLQMSKQMKWETDSNGTFLGTGLDGSKRIGAFARLPSTDGQGYFASLATPSAPLIATATASLVRQLIVLAFCALVGFVLARWVSSRYLLPDVQAVVSAAERVSRDEMSLALSHRPRTPELASIVAAFERALERTSQEQRDYLALANASGDRIVRCDRRLWIVAANDALVEDLGVPRRELIGRSLADGIGGVLDPRMVQLARRCVDEGTATESELMIEGGVQGRWMNVRCVPVREGNGPASGVLLITRDMTEQRMLQRQLERSQRIESVGRFAGGIAHDFNNMLTVVMNSAELAATELPPDHPAQTDLEQIQHVARRSSALARQLLSFARRRPSHPEAIVLADFLRDNDVLLRRLLGSTVDLHVEIEPANVSIWFERSQLDQVLVNLAANARDAMPRGGRLLISARAERVAGMDSEVAADLAPGEYVHLSVADTGAGMTEEEASRVFEPFFTTKPEGEGTGLGLAVVYGAVRQHGGAIWVDSTPGHGTTFHLLLQRPPAGHETVADTTVPATTSQSAGTCAPVLVVDDDENVRRVVRRVLVSAGYEVADFANGEEALAELDRGGGRYRLVITDLVMPRMSGGDLVQAIIARDPTIGIVVASGFPDERARLGFDVLDHVIQLPKPFTPDQLFAALGGAARLSSPASPISAPE